MVEIIRPGGEHQIIMVGRRVSTKTLHSNCVAHLEVEYNRSVVVVGFQILKPPYHTGREKRSHSSGEMS